MSAYSAYFLVQRGDNQFICKGDKLHFELRSGDWLAVQRGDTLYRGHKTQIQDSDWLVCMDGNKTCRVEGSKVIPLLLPPPPLAPVVVKVNGSAANPNVAIEVPANSDITLEVVSNSESDSLTKSYQWINRMTSGGTFTSSDKARLVSFNVGPLSTVSVVSCEISAVGSQEGTVGSDAISIYAV